MTTTRTIPDPPDPTQAMDMYRFTIEDEEEAAPLLTMGFIDNTISFMDLRELGNHPTDSLRLLVGLIETGRLPELPGIWPVWALVSVDAYHSVEPHGTLDSGMRRGMLRDRFEAGDPAVTEAIATSMMHCDGHFYFAMQPYVRKDDGTVVWDKIDVIEEQDHFSTDTKEPHIQGDMAYWLSKLVKHI